MALLLSLVPFAVPAEAAPAQAPTQCVAPPLPPAGTELVVDPASVTAPAGAPRPASPGEAREVRAAMRNFAACVNSGDHLRASTLFTAHFVRDYMGQDDYRDVPDVLGGLTMEHVRIERIRAYADGSFVTEGRYLAYGHQLVHARTTWWPEDGVLKVNWQEVLPSDIPRGAEEINVEMGEYFYRLDRSSVCPRNGALVLRLRNVGAERHEAVVFRLPEGRTGEDIFNGELTPDQVVTLGQGGNEGEVSLIRVPPGTYTLVDFVPAPDGRPHGMLGQTAQFRVC
jgi:hypothetical protein